MMGAISDKPVFVDWIELCDGASLTYDIPLTNVSVNYDVIPLFNTATHTNISTLGSYIHFNETDRNLHVWDSVLSKSLFLANRPMSTGAKYNLWYLWKHTNTSGDHYAFALNREWLTAFHKVHPTDYFRVREHVRLYQTDIFDDKAEAGAISQHIYTQLKPCYYHGEYGLWDSRNNAFVPKDVGAGYITGGND